MTLLKQDDKPNDSTMPFPIDLRTFTLASCLTGCLTAMPQATWAEASAPSVPEQNQPEQKAAKEPPPPAEKFDLLELRIKGNTLLESKQLERTVYPFLGLDKTIDNVMAAQKALEDLYHSKGYETVVVDVPEQTVEKGIVYLDVMEGKVSSLRVKGSRYFSLNKIKSGVPEIAEGKVPNFPVMQEQIAALSSQSEDRKITPIMRPGASPGTLEVDLNVKDEFPLHGHVELNGRNTNSTTRLRLISTLRYDNLWQKFHSASFTYQVSPENSDEVDVIVGTYSLPFIDDKTKLSFYAVSSFSDAAVASGGAVSVIGIGEIYGMRLSRTLPGYGDYSHSLTLGVDYKNFEENLNLVGADNPFTTPIDYVPFSAQYSSSLNKDDYFATFNAGVNFAVRGLGNGVDEFANKRSESKPNYAYLTTGASINYKLPWEDIHLIGRVNGQIAESPLISNEQFSLGGMQSVRGYFETQALADDGFAGSVEVLSPRLAPMKWDTIDKLHALAFVDGGMGWIQKPMAGTPEQYSLASAGVGLRMQVWKYFSATLDLGVPLLSLDNVKAGHPKFHFIIATDF